MAYGLQVYTGTRFSANIRLEYSGTAWHNTEPNVMRGVEWYVDGAVYLRLCHG